MIPQANQRLQIGNFSSCGVDDGLINQPKSSGLHSLLQDMLYMNPFRELSGHVPLEEHIAIAAQLLGVVHSYICLDQELFNTGSVIRVADYSYAGGKTVALSLNSMRFAQIAQHLIEHPLQLVRVCHISDHNQKLVAAESVDRSPRIKTFLEYGGQMAQDCITVDMAEGVVDALEVV